ncbi:MAG TPA: hypothetical protein VIJ70_09285 [Gaiellaceae bacterium]
MPPKTPRELKEQIDEQAKQPAKEGSERTAEGLSVETPSRDAFFGNLAAASQPRKDSNPEK